MTRFFLAWLLLAPGLSAQSQEPAPASVNNQAPVTDQAPSADTDSEASVSPGDEEKNREGEDDFVPSQQISEDLSVSFPVDI